MTQLLLDELWSQLLHPLLCSIAGALAGAAGRAHAARQADVAGRRWSGSLLTVLEPYTALCLLERIVQSAQHPALTQALLGSVLLPESLQVPC